MNPSDIFIIVTSVVSGYIGYRTGFVKILFILLSPVGATVMAKNFRFDVLPQSPAVSHAVTWLVFAGAIYIAGALISKLLDIIMLGFFNRLAGLIAGMLAAVFTANSISILSGGRLFGNSQILSYLNELFKR